MSQQIGGDPSHWDKIIGDKIVGDKVAGDKITIGDLTNSVINLHKRLLTAAEEACIAQDLERQRLAEGVQSLLDQGGVEGILGGYLQRQIVSLPPEQRDPARRVLRGLVSADGRRVVSGSADGTARVWLWLPEDLLEELCSRLTRNFTPEEWAQYLGDEPYRATCPNLPVPTSGP
jgi:WD40 repeat protein